MSDQTPGVQAQLALARLIFDHVSEGITVADCSKPDNPLIYVNRAFERLTGYPAAEALGRNCRFLQGTEKDQPELERLRAAIREGNAVTVVLRNYRRDGTLFYNEFHLSPIRDEGGRVTHYIGIQRDVSDRKRVEEDLRRLNGELERANVELYAANERLREVLFVAAHDIKNPVSTLVLSLGLLEQKIGALSQEELRPHVAQLRRLARHVRDMAVDLLDDRQADSDVRNVELEPLDLRLKVETVLETYRRQAEAKGIRLELEAPGEIPPVRGDRSALLSVIDNLVSNALKFSPAGATVRAVIGRHGVVARLAIRDEGPGLTEEDRSRLFGPFARLSAQPTGGEHSSGVGLYIVKKYVELMEGRIWCDSEAGRGATFTVELPLADTRSP